MVTERLECGRQSGFFQQYSLVKFSGIIKDLKPEKPVQYIV